MAPIKVILAGNPGRGKSTIGNALLSANVFEEGTAPNAVTTNVHRRERALNNGQQVVVFDTPGLHEANNRNFHRNAACLAQAVQDRAMLDTVVVFVASASGGRVSADDIAAFRSIFRCMNINPAAILVVINKVEIDESSMSKFVADFERTFRTAVAEGELGLRVDATRFVGVPEMPRASRSQRLPEIVWQLLLPTMKHAGHAVMLQKIMSETDELEQRKHQLEEKRRAEDARQRRERENERRLQREKEENLRLEAEQQQRREQDERDRLCRAAKQEADEAKRLEDLRRQELQQPMMLVMGPWGPMLVPVQNVMGGGMFHPGFGGHFMHPGFGWSF